MHRLLVSIIKVYVWPAKLVIDILCSYVKKLRSTGLKTQKMSLTILKFIGDELISDKSIFGFRKFC